MKYKGKVVVLDNFRMLYKDYTVDIQDVIRSAILDGVDITEYVSPCKDDPFRLDQIRLCMKEGVTELSKLSKYSGDVILKFRILKRSGKNTSLIVDQLNKGSLSSDHINHLIKWVQDGRKIDNINVQIIPKGLLDEFDLGLALGLDMSVYNTGESYNEKLMTKLFPLQKKGIDIKPFLKTLDDWDGKVFDYLPKLHESVYNILMGEDMITAKTPYERVKLLASILEVSLLDVDSRSYLKATNDDDSYAFSEDALSLVLQGLKRGVNIKSILDTKGSVTELRLLINEDTLKQNRKINGRLMKK